MNINENISIDKRGICINGQYKILLCASLFYFRIPMELWHDRIIKIKQLGYNCVDVYFPWNYHEISPEEWNFSGQRDADKFLKMLSDERMFVIARPGPYICSEWDGGGIPAWCLASPYPIREANGQFLKRVDAWYSKIIPVISRYQCGNGGTVVMVQLDNELDFFDCPDPGKYMEELKSIAARYGISVPVFGCAGQGSMKGATGFAQGVENTFNIYMNIKNASFEKYCGAIYKRMRVLNKPFLITETNKDYFTLRRELCCGAKLIGPYNQVAGYNFGFTNGINNWGKGKSPLSFITSDYGFNSDISPVGEYREKALEARLFSGLIKSLGSEIAVSLYKENHGFDINANFPGPDKYAVLELENGGMLICIPNIGDKNGTAYIKGNGVDFYVDVEPLRASILPVNIPLGEWDVNGMLVFSSAEIAGIYKHGNKVTFILYADRRCQALFDIPDAVSAEGEYIKDNKILLSGIGDNRIIRQGNKLIKIMITSRQEAARIESDLTVWKAEIPTAREAVEYKGIINASIKPASCSENVKESPVLYFEDYGLWRGYGIYKIKANPGFPLLLKGAADIVSAYDRDEYLGTRISGGQWQRYSSGKTGEWNFRVEIWGHSNFDDPRLKSLRLKSSKGIESAYEIIHEEDLSDCWYFDYIEGNIRVLLNKDVDIFQPLMNINSWNSTRTPMKALYSKNYIPSKYDCDSFVLEVEDNVAYSEVFVDGIKISRINPYDPYIDLSNYLTPGRQSKISVAVMKKDWSEPFGRPFILYCRKIKKCCFKAFDEGKILHYILESKGCNTHLPLKFIPGQIVVLCVDLDSIKHGCAYVHIEGKDIKFIAVFNGKIVGRIFLDGETSPCMVGGDSQRFYLPGPWFNKTGNKLYMLVEAIGSSPVFDKIVLEYLH
ncbi:MAG: beta-galactosidase [Clostridiales bacterium]|nr:beta-galactosidase [Clostridiales bacterium]